jgi:SAM-dependent methyltransferase
MQDGDEVRRYYDAILPFYDESLADRGDLPFWEAMAAGSKRILELGCGTGRVTEVLVRHGQVTAVDLLVEMLGRASRRVPRANLVAADLRQFAFAEQFDLIVLADDPMAHLISMDDRISALKLITDHLAPDGRLVIEGLYRRAGDAANANETWSATEDPSVWKVRYRYGSVEVAGVMRSWSLEEVAALRVERLWGDFDGSPFSEDSKRMIIVAKR